MATKRIGKKSKKVETALPPEDSVSAHERIALLAYRYWEERGNPGGSDQEDWFRAEREVLEQLTNSKQSRQI
jgi:hypothetical protein